MFDWQRKQERSEQLRSAANELGMNFQEEDEYGMRALLKDFALYKKGGRKKIFNILHKTSGLLEEKISIMDYRYVISTGKSSMHFYQTVFFLQSKHLALPEMLLKPENFFHKIGAWLGMQDIDFVEHPEFSKKFLLQGEDERRIRRTVNEDFAQFFLIQKEWCMESVGYFMILYKEKSLVAPNYVKTLYQKGMALYEHLKTEEW